MGSIDNPKYLQNSRVWLFSGQKDTVVDTGAHTCRPRVARSFCWCKPTYIGPSLGVVKKAKMYYEYYITNASSVAMVTNISSEHAWITNKYGPLDCKIFGLHCLISRTLHMLTATGTRATTWVTPTSTIATSMRVAPCFATSILNRSLILALPPSPPMYALPATFCHSVHCVFVCETTHAADGLTVYHRSSRSASSTTPRRRLPRFLWAKRATSTWRPPVSKALVCFATTHEPSQLLQQLTHSNPHSISQCVSWSWRSTVAK
jgi:hypothetical protein